MTYIDREHARWKEFVDLDKSETQYVAAATEILAPGRIREAAIVLDVPEDIIKAVRRRPGCMVVRRPYLERIAARLKLSVPQMLAGRFSGANAKPAAKLRGSAGR